MPTPSAPFKTPEGIDELRHRTRGLGQRHRTVLLLVDGRRPLGEVLTMARQAGAGTEHLEALVRLGLVGVPVPAVPPAERARATDALPGGGAGVGPPEAPEVAASATPPTSVPGSAPVRDVEPAAERHATASTETAFPVAAPDRAVRSAADADLRVPPLASAKPPPAPQPADAVAHSDAAWPTVALADAAPRSTPSPAPADADAVHRQVQALLLGAVGAEAALFAPRLPARIRGADTDAALIGLVWEIERQRAHLRRSRAQLLSLERARELLGMGNTLVAADSGHGAAWPDTAAATWPDTVAPA